MTALNGGPSLPSRRQRAPAAGVPLMQADAAAPGGASLQDKMRQLQQLPAFAAMQQHPEQIMAALQQDPVLQQAMADTPQLAQLLQPSTLQAALRVVQTGGADAGAAAAMLDQGAGAAAGDPHGSLSGQRKALMQLQGYAAQLQRAQASSGHPLPRPGMQLPGMPPAGGGVSTPHDGAATGAAPDQRQRMWAQFQSTMAKMQQRSAMMGHMGVGASASMGAGMGVGMGVGMGGGMGAGMGAPRPSATAAPAAPQPSAPAAGSTAGTARPAQQASPFASVQQQGSWNAGWPSTPAAAAASPASAVASSGSSSSSAQRQGRTRARPVSAFAAAQQQQPAAAALQVVPVLPGRQRRHADTGSRGSARSSKLDLEALAAAFPEPESARSLESQHSRLLAGSWSEGHVLGRGASAEPLPLGTRPLLGSSASEQQVTSASSSRGSLGGAQRGPVHSTSHRVLRCSTSSSSREWRSSDLLQQLSDPQYGVEGGGALPEQRSSGRRSTPPPPVGSVVAAYLAAAASAGARSEELAATADGLAGRGEVEVVELPPPTRVTTHLAYSTDPTAGFVLEAATSGGVAAPSPFSDAGTRSPPVGWPAAAAAASPRHAYGCRHSSPRPSNSVSGSPLPLDSIGEDSAVAAAGGGSYAVAAARVAAAPCAHASSSGGGASSSSSSSGAAVLARGARGAASRAAPSAAAAAAGSPFAQQQPQQQQPQYGRYQYGNTSSDHSQAAPGGTAPGGTSPGQWHPPSATQAQQPQVHGSDPDYYLHLQQQYQQQQEQPRLSASAYYEEVAPSGWRPSDHELMDSGDCTELYRRAYCSHADALFAPVWVTGVAAVAASGLLPFWLLLIGAVASFCAGVVLFAVRCAGVAPRALATSRLLPTVIGSLELCFAAVSLTQMLPPAWHGAHTAAAAALALLAPVTVGLHLRTYLLDPGYVTLPGEEHSSSSDDTIDHVVRVQLDAETARAASGVDGHSRAAALEAQPLLRGGVQASAPIGGAASCEIQAAGGGGNAAAAAAATGRALDSCWTCGVERPLRSKHCPYCRRCVHRLDHHCPAVGNCIGQGNQRSFYAYLVAMLCAQLTFVYTACALLVDDFTAAAAATAASGGGSAEGLRGAALLAAALGRARVTHPGWLLMVVGAVPLMLPAASLVIRHGLLIAANLTANEWLNRQRYQHLQHEASGYCNRFDGGPLANCWQFWFAPEQDWWRLWLAGDQEMLARGKTALTPYSGTGAVRLLDSNWRTFQARLLDSRRQRQEVALARRLRAAGLDDGRAAAMLDAEAGGPACRRCDARHD